jgi:uncharacterized cupredoxin-like copper-binding protein
MLIVLIAVVAAITTTSAWTVTVAAPGHHDDGHSGQEQKSKKDKKKAKKNKGDHKAKEQSQVSAPAGALGTEGAPRDIVVTMTDTLRFDPGTIAVHEGETIRFLLENPTVAPHDFTLGDMDAQMHHHEEMSAGMGHEHGSEGADGMPGAVSLQPDESAEVIATFDEPGEVLIGCHIPGHWEAGMRGALLVMPGGEPKGA